MEINQHPAVPDTGAEVTRVIREAAQEGQLQDMVVDTNSIQSDGKSFVAMFTFYFIIDSRIQSVA